MASFQMIDSASVQNFSEVDGIQKFISLIEETESYYPEIARNTKLMITKFRKVFYDSFGWNNELIRGTANIPPFPKVADGLSSKEHTVRLLNGDLYDIAHIFAILDSVNHPGLFTPLPNSLLFLHRFFPTVDSRVMASGWLGDLSSVTGQYFLQWKKQLVPLSEEQKQKIINEYCPPCKIISDADALIMPNIYNINTSNGLKVSDILKDFYSDTGLGFSFRKRRYKLFCEILGLKGWDGKSFVNEKKWVKYYSKQLTTCTSFYLVFFDKKLATLKWSFLIWIGYFKKQTDVTGTLELFLNDLKEKIELEQKQVQHEPA